MSHSAPNNFTDKESIRYYQRRGAVSEVLTMYLLLNINGAVKARSFSTWKTIVPSHRHPRSTPRQNLDF